MRYQWNAPMPRLFATGCKEKIFFAHGNSILCNFQKLKVWIGNPLN